MFAEFYSIFACLVLLESKFGLKHQTFLTPTQVKSALLEAGLSPTDSQLQHMFNIKAGKGPSDQLGMNATYSCKLNSLKIRHPYICMYMRPSLLHLYLCMADHLTHHLDS